MNAFKARDIIYHIMYKLPTLEEEIPDYLIKGIKAENSDEEIKEAFESVLKRLKIK